MKIGLFICDHVSPEYQTRFGDYNMMFANLFPELGACPTEPGGWKLYDVCNNQFPENLNECDCYMATGSSHSAYDDLDWIVRLKKVIQDIYEQDKYFIGFCFGHQLMGEALGGKVEKSKKGWCVGVHEFKVYHEQSWMQPFKNQYNMLMMCQDQVVKLPENAIVLAGNEMCPVGMFQIGNKMLGIQGHPEFSKSYDQLLMEKRRHSMGEEVVQKGIKSLEKNLDTDLIQNWIYRFLGKK